MNQNISIKQIIKEAWSITKNNLKTIIPILLVAWFIQLILTLIADPSNNSLINFFASLISWAINVVISIGLIYISINLADNRQVQIKDLIQKKDKFIQYFLGTIFYSLIVIAGLFLLIIPGVIWAIRYQFYGYLIIEKNMSPGDALSKSKEMTKGQTFSLIKLGLVLLGINILGILAIVVGLLVTIPISMIAIALTYKQLLGDNNPIDSYQSPENTQPAQNPNNMWATYRQNNLE